jgi:hypothetical protein
MTSRSPCYHLEVCSLHDRRPKSFRDRNLPCRNPEASILDHVSSPQFD